MKTLKTIGLAGILATAVNFGAMAQTTLTSKEVLFITGSTQTGGEGGELILNSPMNVGAWHIDNQTGNMRFFKEPVTPASQGFIDFMEKIRFSSTGQLLISSQNGSFAGFYPTNTDVKFTFRNMGKTLFDDVVQIGATEQVTTDKILTDPSVKLAVNGKILAVGVKVANPTNWPDFVFAKNFKLRSLEEVESYIAENSHLPEVPSEAEVKANGIDMGEMMKIQMQKIEELTLYMIQLKKENEELNKKVAALLTEQE